MGTDLGTDTDTDTDTDMGTGADPDAPATVVGIERTGTPTAALGDFRTVTRRDEGPGTPALHGEVEVRAILRDGSRWPLLSYYADELRIGPDELAPLVGLQAGEARARAAALLRERDRAYLET